MRPLPTGTITFLFTDIQGSTQLWEAHPDAMRPALARHDHLLRESIEASGGSVFKTVGDAFCAAFATAPEALAAALYSQLALAAEPWGLETPLLVRMALHTGACDERDGDYFGPPLNRVARLLSAGYGGQVILSGATQELVRDTLPTGTTLSDLGEQHLKDLGRPERVYQLYHALLIADFPPLKSLDYFPNNLPQQSTSFIGREKETSEIKALLEKTRLLTLTGSGGAGKTRLSIQVAADLMDQFPDGVWLVELAALTDPALVPQAVSQALGIREEAGQAISKTLVEWLKLKRLLIVLDNCEHLVAACAALAADLLRNCPTVSLLASSRETLNVMGEQIYRVPSLSLPDPKKNESAEALSQYEAVRLFIERAQSVQPSFSVTDANAPAVAQVCWRLDGIPMAIELAAARVRSLSVEEVNARLDNRFRLLTGGARNTLPRQQTLRALIDWSYDLLTDQEQALLRRLSVFAGGWTLEGAEAVCLGDEIEDYEILDFLTSLVDKSLVVYDETTTRYRLMETVRQYASDRLTESGESDLTQDRSASWYLRLAEKAEPQLQGPEQLSWLERLESEHDNLRASLSWFEQSSPTDDLRLAGALVRFWWMRGYFSEGRQWVSKALDGASDHDELEGTEALVARAKALNGAGTLAWGQADFATARAHYEKSLSLFRQLSDEGGIARSLSNLGNVALNVGDLAEARAFQEESLVVQQRLGNPTSLANAHLNLGGVVQAQGDNAAAREHYAASLALCRQIGNHQGCALALMNLASVVSVEGDLAGAWEMLAESLTIRHQLRDQLGFSDGLWGLASIAYAQNHLAQACQLCAAIMVLRETLGAPMKSLDGQRMAQMIAAMRETLGEEAFSAAWDAGRAMTLDEAVDFALSGQGEEAKQ